MTDLRCNVRANLHTRIALQGQDRWGRPFAAQGESTDFSRKGLGLVLDSDIVAPGAVVSVSGPRRFRSNAVVQWVRPDPSTGQTRVGLRLIDPKTGIALKIAASALLCFALLGQLSFSRSRFFARAVPTRSCTMSLAEMKSTVEMALAQYAFVSESDKAFVHVQHQHMTCEQYTETYERSGFTADPKLRAAIAHWHWAVYHAHDESVRAAAIREAEASFHPAQ